MTPLERESAEVSRALYDAAFKAVERGLAGPGKDASILEVQGVVATARDTFEAAVAAVLQNRNATASQQHRLPDELWCQVWAGADLADRITMTYVCHHWRQLALGSPRVWTHVDAYSLKHSPRCECDTCSNPDKKPDAGSESDEEEDDSGDFDSDDDDYSAARHGADESGWTNVRVLCHILPLSAQLPFMLEVSCDFPHAGTYFLRRLVGAVVPHSERLRALYFCCEDASIMRHLLQKVQCFPALQTLSAIPARKDDKTRQEITIPGNLHIPALTTLELGPEYSFEQQSSALLSLRNLRVSLREWWQLHYALVACPNLLDLQVHLKNHEMIRGFVFYPHTASEAEKIPGIRLSGVLAVFEDSLLANFGSAQRQRLGLTYAGGTPVLGFSIFGHLDGPTHVLLSHGKNAVTIQVSASGGRQRALSFPLGHTPRLSVLWDHLAAPCVLTFDADVSVFANLVRGMPVAARATALHLFLDVGNDLPLLATDAALFPALKIMRLRGPAVALSVTTILTFVKSLRLARPLAVLILEHVRVIGDQNTLADVVQQLVHRAAPTERLVRPRSPQPEHWRR